MKRHHGFTLIELMIVIAIMGIMATMAVPSYQDRIVRSQVQEALKMSEAAREAIEAHYRAHGRLPTDNAQAGLAPPEKYVGNFVNQLRVADGALHLRFGQRSNRHLSGKTLTLRPAVVDAYPKVPIAWVCGQAGVPSGMQGRGENQTDLPIHFLPIDCRPGPAENT